MTIGSIVATVGLGHKPKNSSWGTTGPFILA
jgi:hypothetical protein